MSYFSRRLRFKLGAPGAITLLASIALLASACDGGASTPTPPTVGSTPEEGITPATTPTDSVTVEAVPATIPVSGRPVGVAHISSLPVVPRIDAALKARLRGILEEGKRKGNRSNVFAKIGDSITESGSFLQGIGCKDEALGDYASLAPTIEYFRSVAFPPDYGSIWCGDIDSFSRASVSAVAGWSADQALQPLDPPVTGCPAPYNTPLACELHLLKPGIALIMYGTNDLQRFNDLDAYYANLTKIVQQTIGEGVIPILSTIPTRKDDAELGKRVGPYNRVIVRVAGEQQIPLWNYWLALQGANMVNGGLDADGVHPNVYNCPPCEADVFTAEGLRYGYNQRNPTAIQALDKVKRVVIDDGPAD